MNIPKALLLAPLARVLARVGYFTRGAGDAPGHAGDLGMLALNSVRGLCELF